MLATISIAAVAQKRIGIAQCALEGDRNRAVDSLEVARPTARKTGKLEGVELTSNQTVSLEDAVMYLTFGINGKRCGRRYRGPLLTSAAQHRTLPFREGPVLAGYFGTCSVLSQDITCC